MNNLTERIVAVLLSLFVLVYAGYQIHRYYYSPYKVETAFEHTIEQTVLTKGIAIRDELLMESVSGTVHYLHEDGTRVGVEEPVAESYAYVDGGVNNHKLLQIQQDMELLRLAQDKTVNNYASVEAINRDMRQQFSYLTSMSDSGRFSDTTSLRQNLTSLLNKKQIALGKESDFSVLLQSMAQEKQKLESAFRTDEAVIVEAPTPGYFVKNTDGYEELLSPEDVSELSIDTLENLVSGTQVPQPVGCVGKMITDENWYFAVTVPQNIAESMRVGQGVTLSFELLQNTQVPAQIYRIDGERDAEESVVILQSNYISGDLLGLRISNVEIRLQSYTGIRVPSESIRFLNGQKGVYVLYKDALVFRTIQPVYEEQSFVLSSVNPSDDACLKQYDQMVVKGADAEQIRKLSAPSEKGAEEVADDQEPTE